MSYADGTRQTSLGAGLGGYLAGIVLTMLCLSVSLFGVMASINKVDKRVQQLQETVEQRRRTVINVSSDAAPRVRFSICDGEAHR